jgi:hypothetical protein
MAENITYITMSAGLVMDFVSYPFSFTTVQDKKIIELLFKMTKS